MANFTVKAVIPHLIVDGANQALDFYAAAFGADVQHRQPMPDSDRLIHATMVIGGQPIYVVDEFPDMRDQGGQMIAPSTAKGTTVAIALDVDNADAAFDQAVKAGATAHMPLENTFWGARYGQLLDPYGHLWEINQEVHQPSQEQMSEALKADLAKQNA